MEKIYKTMRNTGAASIAVGVIVASVGLAAGIIAIVNGALLLKKWGAAPTRGPNIPTT